MQNKLLSLIAKTATKSKSQLFSAIQPARYLKGLNKQQVGRGKTILITGASSGLGEGMARLFAKLGYNLAICARRMDRLESLQTELMAQYPDIRIEYRVLDVSDYDAIFEVFDAFAADFGHIDRVVVNAGIGESRRIGKGRFDTNRRTVEINFISALAQCEAAMSIFREQGSGHLVVISSMSAMRGLPKHLTAYGASKAGLAHLAEGIRADMLLTKLPIKVSTIYPGYIRTEINENAKPLPFEVDADTGTKAIVAAIEAGVDEACVPSLPWSIVGQAMKHLPLQVVNKVS
ncbi:probable short-chain dehydrogenase/reductase protein [Psychrobacter arcticus 273-4]|uniref:Probable short-chain dehydrogenase/reductase protein n=1 Tax=Psychrobacter arcticus (strain DSM 17307 / VKM B-2377 / 273-4) TaxID=259536 RepID=Q4FSF6_PSYA2|nr:SDR family oxidoreductase [Psychrobacter arcticus]AAZ19052.1 probable short-chain dehydrogenase/reductase protein [Psychrobacter arcticus 273-4]